MSLPPRTIAALGGHKADLVLSDMAAPTTGHRATDHLRIVHLVEIALGADPRHRAALEVKRDASRLSILQAVTDRLSDIRTVVSFPHATAQCRGCRSGVVMLRTPPGITSDCPGSGAGRTHATSSSPASTTPTAVTLRLIRRRSPRTG